MPLLGPAPALLLGEAGPVVDDLELQVAAVAADGDPDVVGGGVLGDIAERLLGDPIGGGERRATDAPGLRRDLDAHLHPPVAQRLGELVEGGGEADLLEVGRRDLAEQGAQLLDRVGGGVGRVQHADPVALAVPIGPAAQSESDGGEVLDDAVVKVAGDPVALRVGGVECLLEQLLALPQVRLALELGGMGAGGEHQERHLEQQHRDQQQEESVRPLAVDQHHTAERGEPRAEVVGEDAGGVLAHVLHHPKVLVGEPLDAGQQPDVDQPAEEAGHQASDQAAPERGAAPGDAVEHRPGHQVAEELVGGVEEGLEGVHAEPHAGSGDLAGGRDQRPDRSGREGQPHVGEDRGRPEAAHPRQRADRGRGEHEGGTAPQRQQRRVGGQPDGGGGRGHRARPEQADIGDQGRRVVERGPGRLLGKPGDPGGQLPQADPSRAALLHVGCPRHRGRRPGPVRVKPAVWGPPRPSAPGSRPRARSAPARGAGPW